jgi:hypothetical protein
MKTENQLKHTMSKGSLASAALHLTEGELPQNKENKNRPTKTKGLALALQLSQWLPSKLLVWLFATIKLFPSRDVLLINDIVITDHASSPINESIRRAAGGIRLQSKIYRAKRIDRLCSIMRNLEAMTNAYKQANPKTTREKEKVLRLVSFYAYWVDALDKIKPKAVCIAITNDQRRLALGIAANEKVIPTACWCVERRLTRRPPPFIVNIQFCWSVGQVKQAVLNKAKAVQMPVQLKTRQPVDQRSLRQGSLGLLLNAIAKRERVKQFLNHLKKDFGIYDIKVRPHPGSKLTQNEIGEAGILTDWKEPLEYYFQTIQGALSMTSGVMNEALWNGLPTVFVNGLDDTGGDMQGLVKLGAIPELLPDQDPTELFINYRANQDFLKNVFPGEFINDPAEEAVEIKRLFTL